MYVVEHDGQDRLAVGTPYVDCYARHNPVGLDRLHVLLNIVQALLGQLDEAAVVGVRAWGFVSTVGYLDDPFAKPLVILSNADRAMGLANLKSSRAVPVLLDVRGKRRDELLARLGQLFSAFLKRLIEKRKNCENISI